MKWQVDYLVAQVTGTNIQKTIFRKKDLVQGLEGEERKRDLKADSKSNASEPDLDYEATKLKTSNSMNNMLPSVKMAHEEAQALTEQKLKEADLDPEEPARKR